MVEAMALASFHVIWLAVTARHTAAATWQHLAAPFLASSSCVAARQVLAPIF